MDGEKLKLKSIREGVGLAVASGIVLAGSVVVISAYMIFRPLSCVFLWDSDKTRKKFQEIMEIR